MANLNIRIPDDLSERLSSLADQTGRTKSYYVREALEDKLDTIEDHYLAMKSLENVAAGKSQLWAQEQLEDECDLDD
ncbi:MAG: ribbon-helix-helix protein, CopG family [Gammaproteobacteria bacterium]|nr:ribbon-helix-helix protein, CopG family [Gammaproteobacteria bacterium]